MPGEDLYRPKRGKSYPYSNGYTFGNRLILRHVSRLNSDDLHPSVPIVGNLAYIKARGFADDGGFFMSVPHGVINPNYLYTKTRHAKLSCKRASFGLRKIFFHRVKEPLLEVKTATIVNPLIFNQLQSQKQANHILKLSDKGMFENKQAFVPTILSNLKIHQMETKTLEELIQLKQDGKIGWVEFLKESEYADDYNQWLSEQGFEASEENAQQYLEIADNEFMDSQDNDYQYV